MIDSDISRFSCSTVVGGSHFLAFAMFSIAFPVAIIRPISLAFRAPHLYVFVADSCAFQGYVVFPSG